MLRVRALGWLSRVGRNPERELEEFKKEFDKASREKDRAALDRLVHPDFSMITPDGGMVSRRGVIAGIAAPGSDFMPFFQRAERVTTFSIGCDLVREIADVEMGGSIPGRGELAGDYTHSAIFVRGPHGWQFFGNTLTRKIPEQKPASAARPADGTEAVLAPEP